MIYVPNDLDAELSAGFVLRTVICGRLGIETGVSAALKRHAFEKGLVVERLNTRQHSKVEYRLRAAGLDEKPGMLLDL